MNVRRNLYEIMGDVSDIGIQNNIKSIIEYLDNCLIVPKKKIIPWITVEDANIPGMSVVRGKYSIAAFEYVKKELYKNDDNIKKRIYDEIRYNMCKYLEKEEC